MLRVLVIALLLFSLPLCKGSGIGECVRTVAKVPAFILALPVDFLLFLILFLIHLLSYVFSCLTFLTASFISYVPERLTDSYATIGKEFIKGAQNWESVLKWYCPSIPSYLYEGIIALSQAFVSIPLIGPFCSFIPLVLRFIGGAINVFSFVL